jgi:diguanylate cyclase (GGDEF)-like protein
LGIGNVKNEKLLNKSGIVLFIVSAVYMLERFSYGQMHLTGVVISFLSLLIMCARYVVLHSNAVREDKRLLLCKITDIALALSLLFSFFPHTLLAPIYLFAIVGASISYGSKTGRLVLYVALLSYTGGFIEDMVSRIRFGYSIPLDYVIYILAPLAFVYVISIFFIKNITFGDEYATELKRSNEQLNMKVAEFYTLQYIQNSISTIRDTRMLFEAVNDMIIGVIGPTYSSIVLRQNFESEEVKTEDFKLWATNIEEVSREGFLRRDCPALWDRLSAGSGYLCKIDGDTLRLSDNRLKCVIVVPLMVKDKKAGMIVISHFIEEALNIDFLRLLEVISGNLSIALENTWLYEKMHDLATIDAVTGVFNRSYFNQVVEEELIKALNRYPMSIVMCDLDYFKSINDNYGHLFGDKVLKEVAQFMQANIRSGDILARYGGEEFAIIFPKADSEQVYAVIERLRQKIEDTMIEDNNNPIYITVSFGVAAYPEDGTSVRRIIQKADEALYQAKQDGKNCTRKASDIRKDFSYENIRSGGDQRDR